MYIISFNINGIRSHIEQIKFLIKKYNPIFICLQETKVSNEKFPYKIFIDNGYKYLYLNGFKNHYGVAIISKIKSTKIYKNFFNINSKYNFLYRILICNFFINKKNILIINLYTPYGESKLNINKFSYKILFLKHLIFFIKKVLINYNFYILILGDFNISPYELDIGLNYKIRKIWTKFKRCSFLLEEIYLFKLITKNNFKDVFRLFNPNKKKFSWFSYINNSFNKNEGLRIDMFLSNKILLNKCINSNIDLKLRSMAKCSDHAPIWIYINI